MREISLCMIVRDEEKDLEDFFMQIRDLVDEIIVVDTGSRDNTKEIVKKFTSNIYDFKWNDDFSAARNFSISKASKDWILVLDPDEKISGEGLIKIREIISSDKKDILGYRVIQKTYCDDKIISIRGICRLFKHSDKIRFKYPIHETVRESIKGAGGRIGKTGIVIGHYPRIDKGKQEYYLSLLKIKKEDFPYSNADKEIENEYKLFNPQ